MTILGIKQVGQVATKLKIMEKPIVVIAINELIFLGLKMDMGQVTQVMKVHLSCYLVLLSNDSKTR